MIGFNFARLKFMHIWQLGTYMTVSTVHTITNVEFSYHCLFTNYLQ